MTGRLLKQPGYFFKRNSQKRRLSFVRLLFSMVVLFSIACNVYQLAPSQKRSNPNISQSSESTVFGAVNDNQILPTEDDYGNTVEDKIFSNVKGEYHINNTTKFNGSINYVDKSEDNYFENDRTEKPKTMFSKADKKTSNQEIQDVRKRYVTDLLMSGIFKAKLSVGFRKINHLSSPKSSNKKNIDHLLFENNLIFAFVSEEKKKYANFLSDMCVQGVQKQWAKERPRKLCFEEVARNCKESKVEAIPPSNENGMNDLAKNSVIDTVVYFGCFVAFFVILSLNILCCLLQVVKTSNSRSLLQITLYCSTSSKTLLMALGLLLSYAPVGSATTLSTQGTYFYNEAPGRYLKGYVNESSLVPSLFHCQMGCDTLHLTCKSLNYVENEDGSNICEINYETQNCALPGDFIVKENSFYVETVPAKDDAVLCSICGYNGVVKKTKKAPGFVCLCQRGFYGDRCEHEGCHTNPCQNGGTCVTKSSSPYYTCSCTRLFTGSDCQSRKIFSSCSDALQDQRNGQNGFYRITDSNSYTNTYCQMTSLTGCSGGGWTLVMKIDGRKETFNYFSSYWQNKQSYNQAGGLSGLDDQETKLPTYWSTSFRELCVGMKVGSDLKFVSISYRASSLYDLIADGKYRTTNLGRAKWKSLIGGSSLQTNCNKEGFNVKLTVSGYDTMARIKIGIIGNQEDDCFSPDSYLGFGGPPANKHNYCGIGNVITTCGNSATCGPDNGIKEIKAMGYIFVR